jgi:hypothetical protein
MFLSRWQDRKHNGKGNFMQTLACLWFELQVAPQRLRASFPEPPVSAKADNLNSPNRLGIGRCACGKPVPGMKPAQEIPH